MAQASQIRSDSNILPWPGQTPHTLDVRFCNRTQKNGINSSWCATTALVVTTSEELPTSLDHRVENCCAPQIIAISRTVIFVNSYNYYNLHCIKYLDDFTSTMYLCCLISVKDIYNSNYPLVTINTSTFQKIQIKKKTCVTYVIAIRKL
ncbi:uncharacterized protein LOC119191139 [Manduca sexta]|uniref:uncharacterized protein LOC119191139 n=1 Tax=Manduca sexta TaxID=7130 RepID=UPI00188F3801|nr:uncharacterized protein LOC119191139 [Manduca sexta]